MHRLKVQRKEYNLPESLVAVVAKVKTKGHPYGRYFEFGAFALVVLILCLKVTNYAHIGLSSPVQWVRNAKQEYIDVSFSISELKYFGKCSNDELKIDVGQQYLCRDSAKSSAYQKIYDTYPRNPNGAEDIYTGYMDAYSIQTANDFLNDQYDVTRYSPATFKGPLTWREDPYNDRFWRYNFYSLRIFKDLLDANMATGNAEYSQKLISVVNSYLTTGANQPHAWDDYHAVAWRSIFLTDTWWKLRQHNELPISTSNAILAAIEQQGAFMLQPDHYEPEFNHAVNEGAALYELGVAFPTLPHAAEWRQVGAERLSSTLNNLVDNDGALTEHSSYYDFYVLDKFWDIDQYADKYHYPVSSNFDNKIAAMVNYASYILQPNLHVPLIGASLDETIGNKGSYAQLAKKYPEFAYVLTQGKQGTVPSGNSIQFKTAGQTVMRSGWSAKNYSNQTQVIFNYGAYETSHSNLAALSFQLYSGGTALMPGPGLYSYTPSALQNYFHGTASENTVLVDGKNQQEGTGYAGKLIQGDGYTSQSAADQLIAGVTHERQLTLIGSNTLVVIDKLHSSTAHTYQQMFHLYPGAHYTSSGLTVNVPGVKPAQDMSITQLMTNGTTLSSMYNNRSNNPGGLCSQEYGQLLPCYQLQYTQKGTDATFVTLIRMGKQNNGMQYNLKGSALTVSEGGRTYTLNINEKPGQNLSAKAGSTKTPTPKETVVDHMTDPNTWNVTDGSLAATSDSWNQGSGSLALTNTAGDKATMVQNINLDLKNKNLLFRLKIPSVQSVDELNLVLRSNNGYAEMRLKDAYDYIHDTDQDPSTQSASGVNAADTSWDTLSLGLGSSRTQQGQWSIYGSGFDWSKVTSVEFDLTSNGDQPTTALLGTFSTFPAQSEGKVAIVFDDGSSSISPAVEVMNKYGYKGSVGVIGKYPGTSESGYLSVDDLRNLKGEGWSLINHSYYHQDAVTEYYDQNNLSGLRTDILDGAEFLKANGLDTDDNWYIYPHGTTNQAVEGVVGDYYKFARTELTAPETFPFGSPLAVKDFVVEDNTSPQDVEAAIQDANTYHQTLLLTFHRIHADSSDQSGYSLNNFKQIVGYLHQTRSNVMSLNQLDASNGVPLNKLAITPQRPGQLDGDIQVTNTLFWQKLRHSL